MKFILRCLLSLLACLLWPGLAHADNPIKLFKSFAGNVNFVGTERTHRKNANNDPNVTKPYCLVYSSSDTTEATISGIPAGAKVLSAQLYWAASGPTGSASADYAVTFDGVGISAPTDRQYAGSAPTLGSSYKFFSGAYDVTAQVTAKRNAKYTFSGLSISSVSPWCDNQTVVGGWAMIVVYSLPTETFRVLNIYEGLQFVQNGSVELTLDNFEIPPLTGGQTGRVAHITWEGDDTLKGTSAQEYLKFNGYSLSNTYNPEGNQFNSVSTINGVDAASYGIDYDAYTVSSPYIQAGQTSATTTYASSQDLVLLNAEIIAVPNTPVVDLGVTLSRDQNVLTYGQTVLYTINVKNYGPAAAQGTIQVVDTLPATLGLVYAGGDGWNCSISGQKLTCSYALPLDVDATAPPILLTAMVNGTASPITNTVTVDGAEFDNQMANNTAKDDATVMIAPYVFTTKACSNGVAILAAGSTDPNKCAFIDWAGPANKPIIAGETVNIWVTLLDTSTGLPARANQNAASTINLRFAMSCVNPTTGSPEFASFPNTNALLPKCAANGATPTTWTSYQAFTVLANSPSINAAMAFNYFDVGRIKLFIQDSANKSGGSGPVVMKPAALEMDIYKGSGATRVNNPGATSPDGTRFAAAGQPFTIQVGVLTLNKNNAKYYAQNFNKEVLPESVDFVNLDQNDSSRIAFPDMVSVPELDGTFGAYSSGRSSGTFTFDEVGIAQKQARIYGGDYIGAGGVAPVKNTIGRFYPDHFNTKVTDVATSAGPILTCSASITCPSNASGMVYSQRDFNVLVTAHDVDNNQLQNYRGAFARDMYLCGAKNQTLAAPAGGICPAVAANTDAPQDSLRDVADDSVRLPATPATGTTQAFANGSAALLVDYYLPNTFTSSDPRASGQAGPTQIFVRATDADNVSSLYGYDAARDLTEGSVVVVNGRLFVPNIFGSELQYLPVNIKAQYWNGSRWVTSETDWSSLIDPTKLAFSNCKKNLASGSNCKTSVLGATSTGTVTLSAGQGKFLMKAPGAGNSGTADFKFSDPSNTTWLRWLPSTVGRATFGVYRNSPVTYIRELY